MAARKAGLVGVQKSSKKQPLTVSFNYMKAFRAILLTFVMMTIGGLSFADPVDWTSEQRAEHRDAVVDATVKTIEKVCDQPTKSVHLMRAILGIDAVHKGAEVVADAETIEILYETSPLGAGYRCPSFPDLKVHQRGRFYLRFDVGLSPQKKAFVLGMGSDVEPIPHKAEGGAAQPASNANLELVLDLRPSQDGKHPVRIAIRNVGSQKMSSEQCMKIFARCVLHISKSDASRSSMDLGEWRGGAPVDISRGDLASHCVRNPVASLFKMEKAGRYILWWTDGNKRSNSLVFERTKTGLERLP
jgi:hypothetical protein